MDRAELREVRPGCHEIALGDRVAAVYVGDDKGVVIQASSGGEPQGLYWFSSQNFATEFLEVAGTESFLARVWYLSVMGLGS